MYIVIPDKSPDHNLANYTDVSGNFFIIHTTTATNPQVGGGAIVTADISAYTLLPSVAAQQANSLQTVKDNAVARVTNKLNTTLSAGVVVSNSSLKTEEWKITRRPAAGEKTGAPLKTPVTSVVLPASQSDLVSFTQGLALVNTAVANAPDPVSLAATNVSTVFGRPITDAQGNSIDMTVAQYQQLMLAFGGIVGGYQANLMTVIGQISAATTAAEVKAILAAQ